MKAEPYLLTNVIQHYSWGGRDVDAFIPALLGIDAEPSVPYAEMWMGAHPKASSVITFNGRSVPLNQAIQNAPGKLLGIRTEKEFGASLPYLFKVLSVSQALSIQAHPDKTQAIVLHQNDPVNYPDSHDKPEIAIALDQLTALAGFRPAGEIFGICQSCPEISAYLAAIPNLQRMSASDWLRQTFSLLMNTSLASPDRLLSSIDTMQKRLSLKPQALLSEHDQLFLALRTLHPGPDIGLLALYFLNIIHLKSNQGIFLEAGIPHAYLSGNIIECMANSDNVVRAGLTSKFRDIRTLIEIVKYDDAPIPVIEPEAGQICYEYKTPVPEFRVSRIELDKSAVFQEDASEKPVIVLCVDGQIAVEWDNSPHAISLRKGQSLFIPGIIHHFQLHAIEHAVLFQAAPRR